MISIKSTRTDGTGMSSPEDPEEGSPLESRTPMAEQRTKEEELTPNLIQRMFGPIWRRIRSQKLNKAIAVVIGALLLVQMALCMAVSHVLKEARENDMNRREVSTRQTKIIHYYLASILLHVVGMFSMWNRRIWLAVVYLVTLLANSYYVLSLLSCTVRSQCPTTALFVAIPQLGSLAWVYWLMLGWLYVLAGLVAYYVATSALDKFGWYEDGSSDDINWPNESASLSGIEELDLDPPSAPVTNPNPEDIPSTSGTHPTYLTMFPNLAEDVSSIFKLVTQKAVHTAEPGPSQNIMMNTIVQSVSSTDLGTVVKNKFQGTVARFWNSDPKYPETAL